MKRLLFLAALVASFTPAFAGRLPTEAKSHIRVLVDLSATWLNDKSKAGNERELETVAATIGALASALKAPVEIEYFEIGDVSLSRAPLCSARFVPSIFPSMASNGEFSDLKKLVEYFGEDCTQLILMRTPEKFTDITGALNTVSRISASQDAVFSGLIVLSDFQEERRHNQVGNVGSLAGTHSLMLYRVLDEDRLDPRRLDARILDWQNRLRRAGAIVQAVDDISLEPAQLKRLLTE